MTFNVTFDYTGQTLTQLGFDIDLPTGWSFGSFEFAANPNFNPFSFPQSGDTGTVSFAWLNYPPNSNSTTLTLNYDSGFTADQVISGTQIYKISGDSSASNLALGPVTIAAPPVAPAITTDPESLTVNEGASASFTAAASGNPAPTFQWKKDGADISGATSATYTIASVSVADAGSYTVVATNSVTSVTSAAATLAINTGPAITAQPESASANQGTDVTFSVTATGTSPLGYQWRKDGSPLSGQTSASLTLSNVQPADAGSYDVVITNLVDTVTSSAATLTVVEAPAITTNPQSQTVSEGNSVAFTSAASGTTPLTYQWSKDGSPISGATDANLAIASAARADAGSYSVTVTNAAGSDTSEAATLTVDFQPVITAQPTDQTSGVGGSVQFSVTAEASPTATYQWNRDSSPLSGETGPTLSLSGLQNSDNGATFNVLITNSVGSVTSATVTLTVNEGPAITTQPESTVANEGSPASFSVVATGNPAPTYQWMKGGAAISGETSATLSFATTTRADSGSYSVVVTNDISSVTSAAATLDVQFAPEITTQPVDTTGSVGGSVTFSPDGNGNPEPTFQWFRGTTPISGATEGTLTLNDLLLSDNGATFYLVATNSVGNVQTDVVTLTVNEGAAITSQPQGATVEEGNSASFYVVATGNPTPTYQWKKDGVDISGATSATFDIASTSRTDSGEYTVVVDNGVGNATSTAAVLDVQYAPEFTLQPVDTAAGVGGSATFTINGVANPDAELQWFRNTEPLKGEDQSTLTVTDLTLEDSGATFYVVATNSVGTATSSTATLTVREIPVITLQPVGGTVNAGGSFTFSTDASGTPTPSFQWRKDGSNIGGATSKTLVLSGLVGDDAGSYDVVVSNAQGSVTSNAAVLVVPTPPTITTAPVGGKKIVGESFTFTVVADGTDPLSYQWAKGGSPISGATSASLTIASLVVEDAGSYTVSVSNAIGSVTSGGVDLAVDKALRAPTITTQPIDTSVRTGAAASFQVVAAGNPVPTYQWLKNNVAIAGQTGSSLTIANAQAADQASYSVVVTNSQGSASSNLVRLTVTTADVAPVINSQPKDAVVGKETSVTFAVGASGVPEPTYQWRKNSVDIAGATSASYTIASAALSDAGTFSVVVTNSAGTVTSRNATLGVLEELYEGTYFGSFGPGRGQFAVTIFADNTGIFLGFDEQAGLYVQGTVTVAADGSFSFEVDNPATTTAAGARTPQADQAGGITDGVQPEVARDLVAFNAKIERNGSVAGTVTGVSGLSMTATKEEGTAASAGYYEANSGGSTDSTFTIVAPSGKVLLVAKTATGGDAGVGTASESGAIAVTTVKNQTVAATVSATTSTIAAEVTSSTGAKTSFSGGSAAVIATQRLVNISSRASAGTGVEQTIAGIVITGQDSKPVLIRAIGPGLSGFGVTGVLAAPKLELFKGQTLMASNTGWSTSGKSAEIAASAAVAGAFALDAANADSVLLETLAPGAYTAIAGGADGGSGVVLIEVYDLSTPTPGQKLFNISTRAAVGSGDSTVVAGFVVSGSVPKRVLLRGAGPALAGFGLSGAITDPQIKLFKGNTQVASNDNWGTNAAEVTAASTATGAFQFTAGSKDAGMVINLEPGAYTLQLSGVGGASGVGLIEVYEIP